MREVSLPAAVEPNQVQVWKAHLPDWKSQEPELRGYLSPSEIVRRENYHFDNKQLEYSLSRGILRLVLGAHLQIEPREVEIRISPAGKPYLADDNLIFNLSHSRNWIGVALGRSREIGLDIQEIYPISHLDKVIEKTFSAAEQEYLENTPPAFRLELFFSLWTAKEAFLKAVGAGFQSSSRSFSVLPDSSALGDYQLVQSGHLRNPPKWTILDLEIASGYKASLAVEGQIRRIQTFLLDADRYPP